MGDGELDAQDPTHKVRLGYLKAEWWPISVLDRRDNGSAQLPTGKKLFIPRYLVRFSADKVLYHYTTVEGFFGIIRENAVWASDVRYMNDVEEIVHGQKMAIETLNRLAAKNRFGEFRRILSNTAEILASAELPSHFVASFSTVNDDLTQWRAYGNDRGICILHRV